MSSPDRQAAVRRFAATAASAEIVDEQFADIYRGILRIMEEQAELAPEGSEVAAELRQGAMGIRTALARYEQRAGV